MHQQWIGITAVLRCTGEGEESIAPNSNFPWFNTPLSSANILPIIMLIIPSILLNSNPQATDSNTHVLCSLTFAFFNVEMLFTWICFIFYYLTFQLVQSQFQKGIFLENISLFCIGNQPLHLWDGLSIQIFCMYLKSNRGCHLKYRCTVSSLE